MKLFQTILTSACIMAACTGARAENVPLLNIYVKGWSFTPVNRETQYRQALIEQYRAEIDSLAKAHANEIRKMSAIYSLLMRTVEYGYAIWFDPNDKRQPVKTTPISEGYTQPNGDYVWHPQKAFEYVARAGGFVLAINHSHPSGSTAGWYSSTSWGKRTTAMTKLSFSGGEVGSGDIGSAVGYGVLCYMSGFDQSLARFDPHRGQVSWLALGNLDPDRQEDVRNETKKRLLEWYGKNSAQARLGSTTIPGERVPSVTQDQIRHQAQANRDAQRRAEQEAQKRHEQERMDRGLRELNNQIWDLNRRLRR